MDSDFSYYSLFFFANSQYVFPTLNAPYAAAPLAASFILPLLWFAYKNPWLYFSNNRLALC